MKPKLLLLLFLLGGIVHAQDTIRTLLITESRMSGTPQNYIEITNMGNDPIQLNQFELGHLSPWGQPPYTAEPDNSFMLPDYLLEPGESYVIAARYEFGAKQHAKGLDDFPERDTKKDVLEVANLILDFPESKGGDGTEDMISPPYRNTLQEYTGRGCWYLEQHLSETDSVVIDQVGGVFDGDNGLNINLEPNSYSVAGMVNATGDAVLIRKFKVKTGNLDFANARGIGEYDGEWIAVPHYGSVWRSAWWTLGNHVNAVINANTLVSDVADVDFVNKTITVPWGTRRGDDIMLSLMEEKPGIAWIYHVSPVFEDSLYHAAKTGDKLEIIACGNEADRATFDIIVEQPTPDANILVPISNMDPVGYYQDDNEEGMIDWPRVTRNETGMDSIWGVYGGIPYATRVDSLLERLEKPDDAKWEIVWVDGVQRPDLKNGDKIKVTAQSGAVKEYFVAVRDYDSSHNADLASITWPDIPEFYKGIFGWIGDTIPNFGPSNFNYRISVPLDVEGIPALVAKPVDLNATVVVDRAKSIYGTKEDRTITFTVTAEDDSVTNTYTVELVKEINPANVQPYKGEPFVSELIFWEQWSNGFVEIANPGNQVMDLSDYMMIFAWSNDPAAVVTWYSGENDWMGRYAKYIPGYKWVNESQWAVSPGIALRDLNVNPQVLPGDVFCMGGIQQDQFATDAENQTWTDYTWTIPDQLDVQFNNYTSPHSHKVYSNPWGEETSGESAARQWLGACFYMYKILNDSIKLGLKPANDPNDFELIEVLGHDDNSMWTVGGVQAQMITSFVRKPHIYEGKTGFGESFGTNPDDCEWTWTNEAFYIAQNAGWPQQILYVGNNLGQHFMDEPTHYKSTVSSVVYKVTEGYGKNETLEGIRGMTPGTTAAGFLSNIIKANENQILTLTSTVDGSELTMDALIANNDTLTVISADSTNLTKYLLEVSEQGLSSDAILKSTLYTIEIISQPKSAGDDHMGTATIEGFEYGTSLRTVVSNITMPDGATMDIINDEGAYVPKQILNFDSVYVDVTVNDNTYFNVTAEDGVTQINYQLIPEASANSAFITSDVYSVLQRDFIIEFVPRGTNVQTFMGNLVPSAGATLKLVDKMGYERPDGQVADDDKVIVTSPNGMVTSIYFISKLATEHIPQTTYLAYITSDVYNVDQVNYMVTGVSGTVAQFLANITPAMGATAVVVDASENIKESGNLEGGDMVKVTSADGKIAVMYDLTTVDAGYTGVTHIVLYPNPTNGVINIRGVKAGDRIQVHNKLGVLVRDIHVQRDAEIIPLADQPAGMYIISISNKDARIGRYKAIKY
jgi:hypothetical protein